MCPSARVLFGFWVLVPVPISKNEIGTRDSNKIENTNFENRAGSAEVTHGGEARCMAWDVMTVRDLRKMMMAGVVI